MRNLEPGCKAIVINGAMNPDYPTNLGKIVTVGNCLGPIQGNIHGDVWEVLEPMITEYGGIGYYNLEKNLQRIDDHDTKLIEEKKELEIEA